MSSLVLKIGVEPKSILYDNSDRRLDEAIAVFVAPKTDPNEVDARGNNVLHLLCTWKCPDVMLIKTSFIFGVDPTAKNKNGQTPLDVLKLTAEKRKSDRDLLAQMGANKALEQALDVVTAFALRARADSVIGEQFNLLSLDGGGIRGVITARTLQLIERMTGRNVSDCFHWYAGTSTGGIIATLIGILKRSPEYCWKMYLQRKRSMFAGNSVSRVFDLIFGANAASTANLEQLIKDEVHTALSATGENKPFYTMEDIAAHKGFPKLTIVTLDVTHVPAIPTYFRNYNHVVFTGDFIAEESRLATQHGIWPPLALTKILRATSAAPTYFQPVREGGRRFIDGGLTANNPISVLVQECDALSIHPEEPFMGIRDGVTMALSLGTGGKAAIPRPDHDGLWQDMQLFTLFEEQSLGQDGKEHERARARFTCDKVPFLRLSPVGINIGLATVSNQDMIAMLWETDAYLLKNKAGLQWVADMLCGNVQLKRPQPNSVAQLYKIIEEKAAENSRLKDELDVLKLELQRRAAVLLQTAGDAAKVEHSVNMNGGDGTESLLPNGTPKTRPPRRTRCTLL